MRDIVFEIVNLNCDEYRKLLSNLDDRECKKLYFEMAWLGTFSNDEDPECLELCDKLTPQRSWNTSENSMSY